MFVTKAHNFCTLVATVTTLPGFQKIQLRHCIQDSDVMTRLATTSFPTRTPFLEVQPPYS